MHRRNDPHIGDLVFMGIVTFFTQIVDLGQAHLLEFSQVYSDLEVAFIISENQTLLNTLAKAGDVTYGRTAISSQFYYGCLLHELLSFQLPERHITEQV